MITFTKSYKTSNGQVFGSIEEAQVHEIELILTQSSKSFVDSSLKTTNDIALLILDNKDKLVDILTTTYSSE